MKTEVLIGCPRRPLIYGRSWEVYFHSQHDKWINFSGICFVSKPTQRQLRSAKNKYIRKHKELLIGVQNN